jgi:small Trp-rich protein
MAGGRIRYADHFADRGAAFFEVWKFAQLSRWWIVGLTVFAFVWFKFLEPMLGFDKRKAHDEDGRRRKARVKQSSNKKP